MSAASGNSARAYAALARIEERHGVVALATRGRAAANRRPGWRGGAEKTSLPTS